MNLTPEDLDKLQTKELANIIWKLGAGKILTAREEAILAKAQVAGSGSERANYRHASRRRICQFLG